MTSEQKQRIENRLNRLIAYQDYYTTNDLSIMAEYAGSEIDGMVNTLDDLGYDVEPTGENDLWAFSDGSIIAYKKVRIKRK